MTFPQHWTLEQKREAQRLKTAKYRATHREYMRLLDKKRYPLRKQLTRSKIFEGRRCRLCEIPLVTPVHGADGTRVHCLSCSKDLKTIGRLRMREWRKKHARIPTFA